MSARSSRRGMQRFQALALAGALHPYPAAVVDPVFRNSAFFDPDDLLQVKYEMLRSVQVQARPVVEVAAASAPPDRPPMKCKVEASFAFNLPQST